MDETFAGQNIFGALSVLDVVVLGASLVVLGVIAWRSGRKEEDTADFFLGHRRVPTLVACMSFVATEVSAVTIVGVPASGYSENWQYLQFFVGSAAARILVAFLFIPVFYKYDCTSIYEFLKRRFGPQTQYSGSVFFFITRLLASSVRLYAACLGVSLIMGWSLLQTLVLFTVVSIAFIAFGGIKAVVWTGAYEAVVFYLAGLAVVGYLVFHIQGGLSEAWRVAGEAGRLSLFNFKLSIGDAKTFWGATMNAFFIGLAVFGTDQELVQRLLTVRTRRSSQRALVATIAAGFPLVALYLGLGTLLFVFYAQHPQLPQPSSAKEVLSHFVVNALPIGLKGLVLAAIILASIDSPLSSLTSSFVTDIYRPLIVRSASERHYLWVSRLGIVAFGVILAILGWTWRGHDGILWIAFQIFSVTGGCTLGVFLLGVLTKRRGNWGNVYAMVLSALCTVELMRLSSAGVINLGWTWLIVIGTGVTFALGYILGPIITVYEPSAAAVGGVAGSPAEAGEKIASSLRSQQ